MFSQQHYEALQKVLKETRQKITEDQEAGSLAPSEAVVARAAIGVYQLKLHAMLSKDNPKFKELLFIGGASEHSPEPAKR